MKPTLHSLIIGINAYDQSLKIDGQYAFGALQGCVRDAESINTFLAKDESFEYKPTILLNENATKAKIVAAFGELAKAEPGSNILIFYSGHGTVEVADSEAWKDETDGRLEGLACYYDKANPDNFILADKELRYLLHSISKPEVHITALFDCCHSGDNTRTASEPEFVRKQSLVTFKQRPWSEFIFADQFKREDFIGKHTAEVLPEGQYIQLAASESNEPAIEALIERERHGVFAYFLLDILNDSKGHISYRDLCNRIRNRIRFKYGQRIKIYTPEALSSLQDAGFLQKSVPDISTGFGAVDYNAENNEYRINRGVLDRVAAGKTKVTVTDGDSTYTGLVSSVQLDTATVHFDGNTLSKLSKKGMAATLEGLASRPIRVYLENKELPAADADAFSQQLFSVENETFVQLESNEDDADYTLLLWADMYYLTKPKQINRYRPVVMPVFMDQENALEAVLKQLQQMAQWHFMLDLKNDTSTQISTDALQVEILDGQGNPIEITNNLANVRLSYAGQTPEKKPVYTAPISIRLTNRGIQDLYVASALLMDYGCMVKQIVNPDGSRPIEPSHSEDFELGVGAQKTKTIHLSLDEATRLFNHDYGTSTLKFLISLTPITGMYKLDFDALPLADGVFAEMRGKDTTKGNFGGFFQTLPVEGWNALNIEIRTNNPVHNTPDWDELSKFMDPEKGSPYAAHFITGLYLTPQESPSLKLAVRSDLDGLEKGGIFSAVLTGANYWFRFRRNQQFKKMAAKYPDLPRMVSEGDSWFQHPLLDDIIDNIARHYPTYCLAAAGDTIRNYFSKGDVIKAVRDIKPAILVLSGGGNDILGEDMPKFLNEYTAGDPTKPDRFFNQTFKQELHDIVGLYRNLFEHFKTERPICLS